MTDFDEYRAQFPKAIANIGEWLRETQLGAVDAGLHPEGTIRFSGSWDQGLVR